jgi:pSer/pThr/pTyr-binding forkhead associated (FHA) protein
MNLEKNVEQNLYELLPTGKLHGKKAVIVPKRRLLVGRSEACDLVLKYPDISAIHAVLEVSDKVLKVYDMNSRNGTYVNDTKIVAQEFKLGDILKFGSNTYIFKNFEPEEALPPALDMLEAVPAPLATPPVMPSKLPDPIEEAPEAEVTPPPQAPKLPESIDDVFVPRVQYPLAKDPKAEFSEYIFEDAEQLYPIFNYDTQRASVEVIILFQDKIYSVDYLPMKNGTYKLVGWNPSANEIEYAYLGKEEKVPFVEITNGEVLVHPIHDYECLILNDSTTPDVGHMPSGPIMLKSDDILRYSKGDLQIFIRGADAPPKVATAPIFRRDKELKKYFLLVYLILFLFLGLMYAIDVDPDADKEKIPERIATILYKKVKKKTVASKAVVKTKEAPKKVVQKSTQVKKAVVKTPTKQKQTTNKAKANVRKNTGAKKVPKIVKVKKAPPKKGPKNKIRPKVTQAKKKTGGKTFRRSKRVAKSRARGKAKGHVDTYKSFDFSSSLNSLVSKGGAIKSVKAAAKSEADTGLSGVEAGGESATLRKAKVSQKVGSLTGAASGRLDTSKGVEGLVQKRGIRTVGIPASIVVLGGMDPSIIRDILLEHIPQFRYCYQKELDRAAREFDGSVPLVFTIGASGHVTRAGVGSTGTSLPGSVKGCVVNVLKGIKFPEPPGGGIVEVRQPMSFYAKRK